MGRRRRTVGVRADDRRAALRRPSPRPRQDARAGTDRADGRSQHGAARAVTAGGLGNAGHGRRGHRQRDRRRREHARRDQRHRHDLPRRVGEPDELAQAAALLRDRQGEPAAADPAQRVGGRRSPAPSRPVHPGRGQLPRPHADVEDGHPVDHRRVRPEHRRRRVHAGDERLHGVRQGPRYGLPRWPAAREDGDRRDRRRGDARRCGDAQPHERTVRLPRDGRDRRAAHRTTDRPAPPLATARPGPDGARRRPGLRPGRTARLCVRRRAHPVRHPRGAGAAARRESLRGVQAVVRRQARLRLGVDLRLPGRHPRQQRDPLLRGGEEGLAVHPVVQPDEHRRCCSSTTSPGSWSGRRRSRAASSSTGRR